MQKKPKLDKDIHNQDFSKVPQKSSKLIKYLIVVIIAIALYSILVNIPEQLTPEERQEKPKGKGFQIKTLLRKKAKLNLAIPKIAGKIPTGENIKNHFKGMKSKFIIVVDDNIPVHNKPSFEAEIISNLAIAERIRIVFLNPEVVEYDGKRGRWAFVTDEYGQNPIGWVLDTNFGYQNRFKRVEEEWYFDNFVFRKGKYFAQFAISDNGRFKTKWRSSGKGIYLRGFSKGRLYQYKNIIWAKKEKPDGFFDIFYIDEDGKLNMEHKYRNSVFAMNVNEKGD